MCYSSCFLLYAPDVPLEEITCPCGMGYWDVFTASFIDGNQIRSGKAISREKYQAKIRSKFSAEEYEARIRHQWIVHFLDCEIKRRLDDQATTDGRNDGSTLRRAATELFEISQGDFTSRGKSKLPARTSSQMPPKDDNQPSSKVGSISASARRSSDRFVTPPLHPETTNTLSYTPTFISYPTYEDPSRLPATYNSDRSTIPSSLLDTTDPHLAPSSVTSSVTSHPMSEAQSRSSGQHIHTERRSSVEKVFIPCEGISWEIIKHHQAKETFGRWQSAEKHVKHGREGYLIGTLDSSRLDSAVLSRLKDESRRFEMAVKVKPQRDSPQSLEDQRRRDRETSPSSRTREGLSRDMGNLEIERHNIQPRRR